MSVPPKKTGGFSLYADLLDDKKSSTISGAPVKYDIQKSGGDDEVQKQTKRDASLKFQPIKRPQVPQKAKPKASSSTHKFSSSTVTAGTASSPDVKAPAIPSGWQKSNFEDWVGDEDDAYVYQDNRPRGSKKQRNKKNKNQAPTWDWDDIYDPSRPNNYADYKGSEEQSCEIRDWKARLYYHQLKAAKNSNKNGVSHSDGEDAHKARPANMVFAPPTSLNFAPPSFDDAPPPPPPDDEDDYYPPSRDERPAFRSQVAPTTFAPASGAVDATGEDVYMRRMQMSGMSPAQSQSPPVQMQPTPPPSQPVAKSSGTDIAAKRAEALAKIAAFKAKHEKPKSNSPPVAAPVQQPSQDHTTTTPPPPPPPPPPEPVPVPAAAIAGSTISRAPVRYEKAAQLTEAVGGDTDTATGDVDMSHRAPSEDERPSKRPGKKDFAQRLLKKYGWEKGQGLGAQGEGITTALVAKAEKRKKKSDAQGGGWAAPANMGKIVGGKKRKIDDAADPDAEDDPRFGKLSEVIKLESMLTGLDVQHEIEDNNLMQEIGEHMGKEYGNVERVFIWRESMGGGNEVFVKFTSQLSALNAVNGMGGTEFAGNLVKARFWDGEMFEQGEYV